MKNREKDGQGKEEETKKMNKENRTRKKKRNEGRKLRKWREKGPDDGRREMKRMRKKEKR